MKLMIMFNIYDEQGPSYDALVKYHILGESKKMSVSNKGAFLTNGHFF